MTCKSIISTFHSSFNVAAGFFRRNARSESAAEGGCGGNSAAPERSAGAKRRRSVPFKESSRKVYNYSTSREIASGFGSPRSARRLIGIQFWGQKQIGGFAFWGKKIF